LTSAGSIKKRKKQHESSVDFSNYIGKKIYTNGDDWKIIQVSKENNQYKIHVHNIDDFKYQRIFEISEVQLKTVK